MIEQLLSPLALAVLVAAYVYRSDFQRYSIGTIGVFKRLDRSAVTGGGMDCVEVQCIECGDELVTAERREFWKEIVVFGAPIWKREVGESYYCEDHVSFELRNGLDDAEYIYAERLPMGLFEAIGRFVANTHELEIEDDPQFQPVSNTVHSASTLIAIMPVVLLVALLLSLFDMLFVSDSS